MQTMGVSLGDLVVIQKGSTLAYVIVGDTSGPNNTYMGEVSSHLARQLGLTGINSNNTSVNVYGSDEFNMYFVPGVGFGQGTAVTQADINNLGYHTSYYNMFNEVPQP